MAVEDGVSHVHFLDRNILDEANILMMADEIYDILCTARHPWLLIDFTNVDHLSSAAIGTLITISNRVRLYEGTLALCSIDRQIMEVFTITRLVKLFHIYETAEQAMAEMPRPEIGEHSGEAALYRETVSFKRMLPRSPLAERLEPVVKLFHQRVFGPNDDRPALARVAAAFRGVDAEVRSDAAIGADDRNRWARLFRLVLAKTDDGAE
ncbi:MAG: STAS domain-containing protein [Phycisphaerales bacterium]|nr:STAS domain-containing protein [Phycisphaerales bacterium]